MTTITHETNGRADAAAEMMMSAPEVLDISQRAMIVRCNWSNVWTGVRKDDAMTRSVLDEHDLDEGAGYWRAHLVPDGFFKDVAKAKRLVVATHEELTLPWDDTPGGRIARVDRVRETVGRIEQVAKEHLEPARAEIRYAWQDMIRQMQRERGPLFDPRHYPHERELPYYWTYDVLVQPVRLDWRSTLTGPEMEAYQRRWERHAEALLKRSMREPWDRLYGALRTMVKALNDYAVGNKKTVHASTLRGNIDAVLAVLPALNLAGDPALDEMAERIRDEILTVSPDAARKIPELRAEMIESADDMMARMAAYITPPDDDLIPA